MKTLVLALALTLPGAALADVWWVNQGDSYRFVYSYPARDSNIYPQMLFEPKPVWPDDSSNPEPSEAEGRGDMGDTDSD